MKIATLQTDHESAFNEAKADLDWHRIACLLDSGDGIEICRYMRHIFTDMCESVEGELPSTYKDAHIDAMIKDEKEKAA